MKSTLHIDINQYEFIEIEKDGDFTPEEVVKLHKAYYKIGSRENEIKAKTEKTYNHKAESELNVELDIQGNADHEEEIKNG